MRRSLSCRHCGLDHRCADDNRLIVKKERDIEMKKQQRLNLPKRISLIGRTQRSAEKRFDCVVLVGLRQQQSVMATVGACDPLLFCANNIKATLNTSGSRGKGGGRNRSASLLRALV